MSEARPVTIVNRAGLSLYGTLHEPDASDSNLPVVVLLSPGVKMRVGPGRLYISLTDALTSAGYTVLRFDFFGLGDSEGELTETFLADVYNHIQVGRYVSDTLDAMEWLKSRVGCKKFVLGGLCGGAITGLFAAQREPSVVGLLSIGMPVTLSSNSVTPASYLTQAQLSTRRSGYMSKLFEVKSWFRFFTFQSEYGVIWRSLVAIGRPKRKASPTVEAAAAVDGQRGNTNPLFPPAYIAFLERGGRVLMLFSEKDAMPSDYDEKFMQPHSRSMRRYLPQIHYHVVKDANHVLTLPEWRREMVGVCKCWIQSLQDPVAENAVNLPLQLTGATLR